jgi:SPP1 gp7 family putative phage head morphogenesis protein
VLCLSNQNARRQANINANRFEQLMKDIKNDVNRRTANAKDLDAWLDKLGGYVNRNPFTEGGLYNAQILGILENIMSQAKFKGLARGGTAELVKGVISENTMHYVTKMGADMQNNLRRIAVDNYNNKGGPAGLAKRLGDEIDGLSKTRAKAIARTETMRANNLSNLVNAKMNMGAKSYRVISATGVCSKCEDAYKNGTVWFDIDDLDNFPPLHPNCRCVVVFSTKTAEENNAIFGVDDVVDGPTTSKDIGEGIGTLEFDKRTYHSSKLNIYSQTMSETILSNGDIINAIDKLPTKLKDFQKNIYVVNAPHPRGDGLRGGGMRIRGTDDIVLFVTEATPKSRYIKHVIPHELTHTLKNVNYNTYKNQIRLDDMNFQLQNREIRYPTRYAKQKKLDNYQYWDREDLADSVANYLKYPRRFEEDFPNRSEFIKTLLGL